MRKIREILRLKAKSLSDRAIAESVGCSRSTAQECLRRARAAGISWPLPAPVDEADLEARLYPSTIERPADLAIPEVDFTEVERELARKHVTRRQLWREYRDRHQNGLGYTSFCVRFARWRKTTGAHATLAQDHPPGKTLFVDYSGDPGYWIEPSTGERKAAQLFIAAWGFSHKLFAYATARQTTEDWLNAQVAALRAFGCVPQSIVPDNPATLMKAACRYEPELNPSYRDFAEHYGVAILPARVRKPRDKAKVENAVLIAQRRILGALRDATFFSISELNTAIAAIAAQINQEAFQKRDGTRDALFEQYERPAALPLPDKHYEYATWKKSLVHRDHHIEVAKAYYSVPFTLIGAQLDVRIGTRVVEIFQDGKLIATHHRADRAYLRRTIEAHRPPEHRAYLALGFGQLLDQASRIGPKTAALLAEQGMLRKHMSETIRSAQGILRLAKDHSPQALERAAARALELKLYSYRAIKNLIEQRADLLTALEPPATATVVHENVRGAKYFH